MLTTLRTVFAIPELRKRLLVTLALLAVYRLGCNLPTPGVDLEVLLEVFARQSGSVLDFVNVFSGRSLERAAVFALGVMPYITASIVLQLLTVIVPYFEKLSKEGELGRRQITRYTRYGALAVALVQSLSIALTAEGTVMDGMPLVPDPGWGFRLLTVLTLTTGCAVVMWLGEQISERGIGNGISLIIFAGIVAGAPATLGALVTRLRTGTLHPVTAAALGALLVAATGFIVFMERSQRRLPVGYARRVAARSVYGGQTTYLPLRVNSGGVIPVIFASSVVVVPGTVASLAPPEWTSLHDLAAGLGGGHPIYYLVYAAAILFFSFFYVSIVFNPQDTAENLRKQGGFVPGLRSGGPTAEHLDRVLTRLTAIGAVYLAGVAILPELMVFGVRVAGVPWIGPALEEALPGWLTTGLGVDLFFGGTSLLIVVGVAMEFVSQLQSHLVMHHYDGFLRSGRPRGPR